MIPCLFQARFMFTLVLVRILPTGLWQPCHGKSSNMLLTLPFELSSMLWVTGTLPSEVSNFLFSLYFYSSFTLAHNYRVYMFEGDEWIGHGRYQVAIKDDENDEAIWTIIDNEHILRLLFVGFFIFYFISVMLKRSLGQYWYWTCE